jgi:Suppressor of fused protein (SUFU)
MRSKKLASSSALARENFVHSTSSEEKSVICRLLQEVIIELLCSHKAIYLEKFGLLAPVLSKINENIIFERKTLVRQSTLLSVEFHKCNELTNLHKEKFPEIIETPTLSRSLYARLPHKLLFKWDSKNTRNLLLGLIETIKKEVITLGICSRLSKIGEFTAIHNRQGETFKDWFAGADIFLNMAYEKIIESDNSIVFERPIVEDSWEICKALYGKPLHIFPLKIEKELEALGYELPKDLKHSSSLNIKVAIFENKIGSQIQLIYCTDGLRNLGLSIKPKKDFAYSYGNELVMQIANDASFQESAKDNSIRHDDLLLPNWPKQILALCWLLMNGSSTKTLKIGAGISHGSSLSGNSLLSKLTTIFVTKYSKSCSEILSHEGPFYYLNITGITDDESQFAENYGTKRLISILKHKKLDQVFKIGRSSVLNKTSFIENHVKPLENNVPQTRSEKSFANNNTIEASTEIM